MSGLLANSDSLLDLSSVDDDLLNSSLLSDLLGLGLELSSLDLPLLDLVLSASAALLDVLDGDGDGLSGLLASGDSSLVDGSLDLKISSLLLSLDLDQSLLGLLATALLALNNDDLLSGLLASLDGNLEGGNLGNSLGLDLLGVGLDLDSDGLDLGSDDDLLFRGSLDDLSLELNDLSLSLQLLLGSLVDSDLLVELLASAWLGWVLDDDDLTGLAASLSESLLGLDNKSVFNSNFSSGTSLDGGDVLLESSLDLGA